MTWSLLIVLLFVAEAPNATPLFGHRVELPAKFESREACKAFESTLRKQLPTRFQFREVPAGEAGPGFQVGECQPQLFFDLKLVPNSSPVEVVE